MTVLPREVHPALPAPPFAAYHGLLSRVPNVTRRWICRRQTRWRPSTRCSGRRHGPRHSTDTEPRRGLLPPSTTGRRIYPWPRSTDGALRSGFRGKIDHAPRMRSTVLGAGWGHLGHRVRKHQSV